MRRELRFPRGFLWGAASSSHQCEGGCTNNQWYRWEQQGHILSGEQCGDAANWWVAAERDFEFAEQMENTALRLSLEWSRIEPQEGQWDSAAIDRYRAMLTDLRRRGMRPVVTLHHFTEPLWFADRDGFADAANIPLFVRYVEHAITALSDLCDFWITVNEPNIYAVQGYDAAQILANGLKAVGGDLAKRDQLAAAMRKTAVDSPRGRFTLSAAGNPVQDMYLREVKGNNNELRSVAVKALADPARGCKL